MRAEELMIGDWVLYEGSPNTISEISEEIVGEATVCFVGNRYMANIDEVEPIPLTQEILEKNGWEERPTGYVFYTDGKRYDNSLWYIFGSNTFVVTTAEFQIKYVHELQHALRLCGIEKTIEL